ncbi:MAG: DoxX family protein [Alphaproteobacteria bacterium]
MIDTRTAPYAALVLRLGLGTMYLAHSLVLKLIVFTLPGTAEFFASVGLPAASAYLVFAAEAVGGLLLVLGIATRWVALGLIPVLSGATWVHAGNGWVFSAAGGGWEYPVFLIGVSVVLALLGDGAHALRLGRLRPAPA